MTIHGVPSKINQPDVIVGNVRTHKHPSHQSRPFTPNTVRDSTSIPFPGDSTIDGNPPPPAAELSNVAKPDNTPPGPDDTDDGGLSTLEKILTPPESDTQSQSKNLDVKVFHCHDHPSLSIGPFIPQPPDPSKERKGAFKRRRNEMNERIRRARNIRSNNSTGNDDGRDGDDEDADDDTDFPDDSNDKVNNVPKSPSSTTANHPDSPTIPRRVLRSQQNDPHSDSQTLSPRTTAPNPKRKRANSKTAPATPTQGQRVSKRQRDSIGDTPLPPCRLSNAHVHNRRGSKPSSTTSSSTNSVRAASSARL